MIIGLAANPITSIAYQEEPCLHNQWHLSRNTKGSYEGKGKHHGCEMEVERY